MMPKSFLLFGGEGPGDEDRLGVDVRLLGTSRADDGRVGSGSTRLHDQVS
jgi:hypothetical protein